MARRPRSPEPFVLFIDENLGRNVVYDAVKAACEGGERVVLHEKGALDEEWLPEAGQKGWICLSKDVAMLRTPNEIEVIVRCRVALVLVGDAPGPELARMIVAALPAVRRVARTTDLSFIARISPDGSVLVRYEGGMKLEPPRRVKQKASDRKRG